MIKINEPGDNDLGAQVLNQPGVSQPDSYENESQSETKGSSNLINIFNLRTIC